MQRGHRAANVDHPRAPFRRAARLFENGIDVVRADVWLDADHQRRCRRDIGGGERRARHEIVVAARRERQYVAPGRVQHAVVGGVGRRAGIRAGSAAITPGMPTGNALRSPSA